MTERSNRRETRNPMLKLPAAREILALPMDAPVSRKVLGGLLRELSAAAFRQGQEDWDNAKAPMAAYYRAVSTYAKHCAHLLDPRNAKALDEMREALAEMDARRANRAKEAA